MNNNYAVSHKMRLARRSLAPWQYLLRKFSSVCLRSAVLMSSLGGNKTGTLSLEEDAGRGGFDVIMNRVEIFLVCILDYKRAPCFDRKPEPYIRLESF